MIAVLDLIYDRIRQSAGWSKRSLLKLVLERVECDGGGLYVVSLPTGYGKSSLVYSSAMASLIGNCSFSTIYASPLRSLADDVYHRFKGILEGVVDEGIIDRMIGLQYTGSPGSIYLNKPVVFTTIDTLSLHILKTPPPEINRIIRSIAEGSYYVGHHEVSRGTLADATVFIDEPHLAIGDRAMLKTLLSIILFLKYINSSVVLLTATMPSELIRIFKSPLHDKVTGGYTRVMRYGYDFIDEEFESMMSQQAITTIHKDKPLRHENIIELLGGERSLVVVNTRRKAVELYSKLSNVLPVEVFILHGFMTKKDRLEAQQEVKRRIGKGEPLVFISTQVVEAGFDASFDALITEEAPVLSLVQRAGRVARWGEDRGNIYIYKAESSMPYRVEELELAREALSSLKNGDGRVRVSWRSADPPGGFISYIELIYRYTYIPKLAESEILSIYRKVRDPVRWINQILTEVLSGRLVRESRLIPLYVEDRIDEGEIPASPTLLKHLYGGRCIKGLIILGEVKPLDLTHRRYHFILKELIEGDKLDPWLKMASEGIEGFIIGSRCYEAEAYGTPSI